MTSDKNPPDTPQAPFPGFPDFQANVTFVPVQFFTLVLPFSSRGCARIVGYMIRKILGWVDEAGNPTRETVQFSYRRLMEETSISRESIGAALREAQEKHFVRCLQPPQPDRAGQSGQSGIYELLWDQEGPYTNSPAEFRGFYYPEAAEMVVQEAKGVVRRSKAARKNIPNVFFDYLLPRERLAVVRVVGALLFYSIQWGPGGERRVPVRLSITELSRLTKCSRQHVHEAVTDARQHGYIEQIDAGCFDPKAGEESRAATYGIRWVRPGPAGAGASAEDGRDAATPDRSEKVNGEPVGKGERDQSEKVDGKGSEKVNGIRIKTELKTNLTTAAAPGSNAVCQLRQPLAAAGSGYHLLIEAGFAEACAKRLAARYPTEAIQRQIEWLPLRNTTRNRLGLLRCAIEQDWPAPEAGGASETEERSRRLGKVFASHYYAAYHGNPGAPITEPFSKEVKMAAKFVERLSALDRNEESVPEWGRRFGALMRQKHRGDAKAKPNLSFALVLYGDELLTVLERELRTRQSEALGYAREFHIMTFQGAYRQYLHSLEHVFQRDYPLQYACFVEQRRCTRRALTGGLLLASADTLARFDGEESRLEGFAEFFKDHPQRPVLDFWQWDAQLNPQRFQELRPEPPSQPASG